MNRAYIVVQGVKTRKTGTGDSFIDREYNTLVEARKRFEEVKTNPQGYELNKNNFLETLLEIEYRDENDEAIDWDIIDSHFLTIEEVQEMEYQKKLAIDKKLGRIEED